MIAQFGAFKDHAIGQVCNAPFAVDLFHADGGFIAGVFGYITASGGQRANDATANGKCTLVTRGGVLRGELNDIYNESRRIVVVIELTRLVTRGGVLRGWLNDIYNATGVFWDPALREIRRWQGSRCSV